ncbi:hypothetical protein RN001_001655 [Aquatica leii]|uniref:Uncharacterized protein n=1 Tax=Aquatica leii TaxID=1421715 RepID=A0AAN7PG66_9COLE|nr:hypothetical protein RN001_001655 [Aquatica leii]
MLLRRKTIVTSYYVKCGFIAFFEEYRKAGDVEQDDPYRYRHSYLSGFTTSSPFHHGFFYYTLQTKYKLITKERQHFIRSKLVTSFIYYYL